MCRVLPVHLSLTIKTISLMKYEIVFITFRTMTVTIGGAERRIKTFFHGPLRLFKMVK
jgi:hypothetical protein